MTFRLSASLLAFARSISVDAPKSVAPTDATAMTCGRRMRAYGLAFAELEWAYRKRRQSILREADNPVAGAVPLGGNRCADV